MHNGDNMIKAIFQDDVFSIIISVEKFMELWDESYASLGEYNIERFQDRIKIPFKKIDLNSFVAEQMLSILDENGEEDESANNECFEDFDAQGCIIRDVVNDTIFLTGRMISF